MQTRVVNRRLRTEGIAVGLIFGIVSMLVMLGFGVATRFQLVQQQSSWAGGLLLFAIFGLPLLAGLLTMTRTGRKSFGTVAGLLTGLLTGLSFAAYLLIISVTAGSVESAVRVVQDHLRQAGTTIPHPSNIIQIVALLVPILLALAFMGIGALFGVIGALIGQLLSPRPNYPRDTQRAARP